MTRIRRRLPADVELAAAKALNGAVEDYIGGAVETALISLKKAKQTP